MGLSFVWLGIGTTNIYKDGDKDRNMDRERDIDRDMDKWVTGIGSIVWPVRYCLSDS